MAAQITATHSRIFTRPLSPEKALANVEQLLRLPQVRLLSEKDGFLEAYVGHRPRVWLCGGITFPTLIWRRFSGSTD